jgi:class 3 adenylate cyclase
MEQMSPPTGEPNRIQDPLYNSRLIKNYVEYIKKFHPDLDLDDILQYAWIRNYELEDQGHWFSQWQIDRFHERLAQKSGDSKISYKVGRYAASSEGSGMLKNYVMGFITPAAAYWLIEKFSSHLSRSSSLKSRKISYNKIEISAIPEPGVSERPYQCDNRLGMLEAVSKLLTGRYPKIDHPDCLHKGGTLCRYIITIDRTPYVFWRSIRPFVILPALAACIALHFVMPSLSWSALTLLFASVFLGVSYYFEREGRLELAKSIESQRDSGEALLDHINIRYNEAQLVKEIGQATSMILEIDRLLQAVIGSIKTRLDFDRGGIWMADKDRKRLVYEVGFGYESELEATLKKADFHLDKAGSRGVAVLAFREQAPFLVNDIREIRNEVSPRTFEFMTKLGTQAFICVPIVYKRESLGVLFVDNIKSKRPLSQSDMSLLTGIATQIATSIHNAMSYRQVQESKEREEKLRKLFEKYVPSPIIKRFLNSGEVELFRGEESSITAMFLDIRGFTSSAENMDPQVVVSFLNSYFDKCSVLVSEANGHINKYLGDGFFAIFGAPEPLEDHVADAFNAARKILEMSREFILEGASIKIGIGLHTGQAIMGNIGSRTKIEYTGVGDTVNTAARLQEYTKIFQGFPIIMTRRVWEKLGGHPDHQLIASLGAVKIRGKKETLEVFGFTPNAGDTSGLSEREPPSRKVRKLMLARL